MEEDINKSVDNGTVDSYISALSAPFTTDTNFFNKIGGIPKYPGSAYHQKDIVKLTQDEGIFLERSDWYSNSGYKVIMMHSKFIDATLILETNMASADASIKDGIVRFSNATFNIQRLPMNLHDLQMTKISDGTVSIVNVPETMAVANITCYICATPDNFELYLNSHDLFGGFYRTDLNEICKKAEVRILKQVTLSTCEATPPVLLEDFDLPYSWDIMIFFSYEIPSKFFEDYERDGYFIDKTKLFVPVSVEMLTNLFCYNPIN